MQYHPYLNFAGQAAQALELYGKTFGVTPKILTFGEAPPNPDFPLPAFLKDQVMFGEVRWEGLVIMASDVMPHHPLQKGNQVQISLSLDSEEQLAQIFARLSMGGQIEAAPGKTFFAKSYASFTDAFGIPWQLIVHQAH